MAQLNEALKIALENARGDAEAFAFYLASGLAVFMSQGKLNENVGMQSIRMLRQLHPTLVV